MLCQGFSCYAGFLPVSGATLFLADGTSLEEESRWRIIGGLIASVLQTHPHLLKGGVRGVLLLSRSQRYLQCSHCLNVTDAPVTDLHLFPLKCKLQIRLPWQNNSLRYHNSAQDPESIYLVSPPCSKPLHEVDLDTEVAFSMSEYLLLPSSSWIYWLPGLLG